MKYTDTTKRKIVREVLNTSTSMRKLGNKYNLSDRTIRIIIKNYSPNDPIKPYKQQDVPKLTLRQKDLRLIINLVFVNFNT